MWISLFGALAACPVGPKYLIHGPGQARQLHIRTRRAAFELHHTASQAPTQKTRSMILTRPTGVTLRNAARTSYQLFFWERACHKDVAPTYQKPRQNRKMNGTESQWPPWAAAKSVIVKYSPITSST